MPAREHANPLRRLLTASGVCAALLAAGCASDDEPAYVERPPETIYNEALAELDEENFSLAAQYFDEVERQHPYSQWATRAQLMAACRSRRITSIEVMPTGLSITSRPSMRVS